MKKIFVITLVFISLGLYIVASADVFNLGPGFTNLEIVTVGNVGNLDDTRYETPGYGAVSYRYSIGKYEVTAKQYTDFLNAKAKTDDYGLYNTKMWSSCKIQQIGTSGNYSYIVADDWANRPVNYVSYWDACRFANWLHNGQGEGDTETGAYTLNGYNGTDGNPIQRNASWEWAVTNEDEWYKAAYYKGGGTNAGYWDYPSQSNTAPSNVGSDNYIDPGNHANYSVWQYPSTPTYTIGSPYYRTDVGEFENSASFYDTFDQGGNVWEWTEAIIGSRRAFRGGSYYYPVDCLKPTSRTTFRPSYLDDNELGFRVSKVSVPIATVTINQAISQSDPTLTSPIHFVVEFSEDVTGFSGTCVSLQGTANPNTAIVTGSGKVYDVTVIGMTAPGTVIVSVKADSVIDINYNTNMASTSTDNVVTFDHVFNVFNMGTSFDGTVLTSLETVVVGNPKNADDTRYANCRYGKVDYDFKIGKYEVTAAQYTVFLNAKAKIDTYELYNASMWSDSYGCKIQKSGSSGNYTYRVASDYANKPVNYVSCGDALRFANWLNNGQGDGDTETGAYSLNGYNSILVRKAGWKWAVTSEDEWYKAAYYDPNKEGGADYWDYPTQSNTINTSMANFGSSFGHITNVGSYAYPSAYGTFDQGGNVCEWNEMEFSMLSYGVRGGCYATDSSYIKSSYRYSYFSMTENNTLGFRVSATISVERLMLNKTNVSINKTVQEKLIPIIQPDNANIKTVTWSSSDINIATVDNIGLVTAVNEGDCIITATTIDGGFAATCSVNVKQIAVNNIGEHDTTGWAYGTAIKNNYACLADGDGFVLFDISNPSSPVKIAEIATAGDMCSVDVSGDYAYMASWGSGLEIIDISDLANPQKVGAYVTTGNACGVAVSGDFAYIADSKVGLEIINISDPVNPIRVGGYNNNGYAYAVAVSGSYAYVTDHSAGFVIIDISDPANPQKVSEYTTYGVASGVAVVGNYMYIADSESGLIIFDVTNPAGPIKIGEADYDGNAYDVAIVGKYAYVADFDEGLVIFDISVPSNPQMTAKYNTTGYGNGISLVGNYIYMAEGDAGLGVIGVGYQVTGNVSLGTYYGDLTNVDMRFGLIEDGSQLWNTPINLDAMGNFTVPYILPGNYDLSIKGSHWLRRIVTGVNVVANTPIADLTLINGDVVDNNEVDFSDMNVVRAAYGSFPGDETWNEQADVDGNGEVDFTDINMVRSNYGEVGE